MTSDIFSADMFCCLGFPLDKGKAGVVMDTQEFKDKIKTMFADASVYKRLKRDPIHQMIQGKAGSPPHMLERPGPDLLRPAQKPLPNIGPGPSTVWLSKDTQERRLITDYMCSMVYTPRKPVPTYLNP